MASSLCVPDIFYYSCPSTPSDEAMLKPLSILFADQIAAGKRFFREAFIRSTKTNKPLWCF